MRYKLIIKYNIIILTLLVFFGFGIACGNLKQDQNASENTHIAKSQQFSIPDTLKPGVCHFKVLINNDALNTFALYLPKLYNNATLWPIVFFFDASGNGNFPISKYKSLADSLGYIFVGSNVSKNGQNQDETQNMWQTLKNACLQNLAIDKKRIVLAGFSGGARVSCAIATTDPNVSVIIANSAGAQNLEQQLNQNTLFIGIAGKGDMNRAEMLNIEQHLSGSSINHFYIEFEGIHEWCPLPIMDKALMLVTISFYFKNTIQIDPTVIERFIYNQNNAVRNLEMNGQWVDAYNELLILTKGVKGLNSLPIESIDSLKNNPEYLIQKGELLQLNAKETIIQEELYNLIINNTDTLLWKNKIEGIRKKTLQRGNVASMHQRLLGYASLLCYSLSNRNLMAKNYDEAQKMITCYQIADPKNAEVYFFKAIVNGANGDALNTKLNLNKSLNLGLSAKIRIVNQSEFMFLNKDVEFKEIVNRSQF